MRGAPELTVLAWARARRVFTPIELGAVRVAAPLWPVVSIALVIVMGVVLPAGAVSILNVYLVALAVAVQAASGRPLPRELVGVLLPFLAMMLIAFLRGVGAETYVFLRDGWYFSNAVVLILAGWVFGRFIDVPARGLRAFVISGALIAVFHLLWFVFNPSLLEMSASEVRTVTGSGFFAPLLAALILLGHLGHWRDELSLHPVVAGFFLALSLASVTLAFSRTMMAVFLVGVLAVAGFFVRREAVRMAAVLALMLAAVFAVRGVIDPDSTQAKSTLIGKFGRVFEELRVTEQMRPGEVQDNWRGYETARAINQWADGGPARWLFGEGMGALLDLGLFQSLNRNPRDAVRFIPTFHNGYVFVLIKSGLVGIVLYLVFLARMYLAGRRRASAPPDAPVRRLGRLLQACAVALTLSTAIFFGVFHKVDQLPVLLMVGFLLAQLDRLSPQPLPSTQK